MKIGSKDFRVREEDGVNLKKTQFETATFFTSNRYAVLLIFQEMNAARKGAAISHVMSGDNPGSRLGER